MLFMLHVASGDVHQVSSADGYGGPDWEELPAKPEGPTEQWIWSGSEWEKNINYGMNLLRQHRDSLLDKTDKFMVPDRPIQQTQRDQWITYRQSLRDLPETVTDPFNFQWPNAPE